MNIFMLSMDPVECAIWQVDKHSVKMPLESVQILSTAHRVLDGVPGLRWSENKQKHLKTLVLDKERDGVLHHSFSEKHPACIWARQTTGNYEWLHSLVVEQFKEYTRRYGKHHKNENLVEPLREKPRALLTGPMTILPPSMPDHCLVPGDTVVSYRRYYILEKSRFATWRDPAEIPDWFIQGLGEEQFEVLPEKTKDKMHRQLEAANYGVQGTQPEQQDHQEG